MLHAFFSWLAIALSSGALLASLYIVWFALRGIGLRSTHSALPCSIPSTRFLIFIPAHNESAGIAPAIESALRASYPAHLYRTIVIADNCDDNTASISQACGAEVWERNDPDNRGKGQALAWAFGQACDLPFDMAVILDADSEFDPHYLSRMAEEFTACAARGQASVVLQGRYDFVPCRDHAHWFEQITIASKAAENLFTYAPRSAFNLVNLIQGNGFAVSRAALTLVPFKASSVVEDAEYAISLALSGIAVRYVGDAGVLSRMTSQIKDAAPQRLRWASGMFQLMRCAIPRLLLGAVRNRDWRLAEAALMLVFTSRVAIVYLTVATGLALIGAHSLHAIFAFSFLILACAFQAIYLGLIVCYTGTVRMSIRSLLLTPAYLGFVWIAQMGAALGLKRKQWNRTVR